MPPVSLYWSAMPHELESAAVVLAWKMARAVSRSAGVAVPDGLALVAVSRVWVAVAAKVADE